MNFRNMDIGKIQRREIEAEMRESYLDYAMSVIVARALPDVRDGLKPVHRRILYAMHEMGLRHDAKYVKSARVVGEVLGKFHPHGDVAVYDALVRLAQPFSLRYPLIQGQGNFGSLDGDAAAAQRYTEARLTAIAEELLSDIEKNTVDFQPNYDATREEPKVLPAKVPNLLLNGSVGIAVGMATNVPPHNLTEVVSALRHLLKNPNAVTEDLMEFIKGPDFPTGGIIYDKKGIREVYSAGRGPIVSRGKAEIAERKKGGFDIIISEIPYEVNKAEMISKIAELVEEKRLVGIRDIRDESDKEGLRVVIELKSDAQPERILNQIYRLTDLEKTFHLNMLALVGGLQPETLSLHVLLGEYLKHRKEVVTRRTRFDLQKTKDRIHILEGLSKALAHIDEVIKTIRNSENRDAAKINLMKKFELSDRQTEAILAMRLESLARLERERILEELKEKEKIAKELEEILRDAKKVSEVIDKELEEVGKKFGDERRTKVEPHPLGEVSDEELITEEEVIIALSEGNYIKRTSPDAFRLQRRGGRGVIGFEAKSEEDTLRWVSAASTHDILLLFSNFGRVFQIRAYDVPEGSRVARGKPVQSLINTLAGEEIVAIVNFPRSSKEGKKYLIMATRNGIIKKTPLQDFKNARRGGTRALSLKKGDILRWASLSSGEDEVILVSREGQAVRFREREVRSMGRVSAGVGGIRLKGNDEVVGMGVVSKNAELRSKNEEKVLVVAANGFGKLTPVKQYRLQKRGGSGIKTAKVSPKTGKLIAAMVIRGEEELIAASEKGQTIRLPLASIPTLSRATQGVRVMKLDTGDALVAVTTI